MRVTTAEMSAILGLTGARLSQLHRDGIIKPVDRNTWDAGETVQSYLRWITDGATGSNDERKRLLTAQADKIEIEVALLEKRALPMGEAKAALGGLIQPVRGALLGLHSKVAQQHPDAPAGLVAYIKDECRKILTDLTESTAASILAGKGDTEASA